MADRTNRAKWTIEVIRRLGIFCACLLSLVMTTGAWAQKPANELALGAANAIYMIARMEPSVPPLETGSMTPALYRALVTPELAKTLQSHSPGFFPFTGHDSANIDDFDLRIARDQPATGTETIVEAAVKSGDKVQLVSMAVTLSAVGKPVVTRIWGKGWTFGGKKSVDAASGPASSNVSDAEAGAAAANSLTDTEQAQLAADDGAEQAGTTSPNALQLPFEDHFEGAELGKHWTIINPDPDKFILENSAILNIANGGDEDFRHEKAENIFQLPQVPMGNFDMTLTGLLEAKTGYDGVWLGLYESAQNFVAAHMYVYTKGCGPSLYLRIVNRQPIKVIGESLTSEFGNNLFDDGPVVGSVCGDSGRARADLVLQKLNESGFKLGLSRRGNIFFASLEIDVPASEGAPGGPLRIITRQVVRTTPAGNPAFELGQLDRAGSDETVGRFDRLVITSTASKQP